MSRIRSTALGIVLVAMLATAALAPRRANALNTAQIVSAAASTDCLDYQVVGVCVWLTCTPFGCSTETSVKVKHFLPDLVVSAYQRTGHNPWSAAAPFAPPNGLSRRGGNQVEGRAAKEHADMRFKNVDAIGDPAVAGFALLSSFGYSCDSEATPMAPYFLSTDDPLAWRAGMPESAYPEALNPGSRNISNLGNQWGHVYPRSGFVKQSNDYKAAAVTAERAADIVTRAGQPHVYIPLQAEDRQGYWPPGPVKEGDASTHKWQRLQPDPSDSCAVFPDRGPAASFAGDIAADGDYAWALWRPYECCQQRGDTLIFATPG